MVNKEFVNGARYAMIAVLFLGGCLSAMAMEIPTSTTWTVEFDPETAVLILKHRESGASLSGTVRFEHIDKGEVTEWGVAVPRDGVNTRLAIEKPDHHIQGYVVFSGTGDRLEITPVHRTRQNYYGWLVFEGHAHLSPNSFACRTHPPEAQEVVQFGSGGMDSALNDSIFDSEADTLLRFGVCAGGPDISTLEDGFGIQWSTPIHVSGKATAVVELVRDYYRDRWAPCYTPVNRERCPSPPTGWMSWNVYFDTAGEEENLAEARIAAEQLKPFGLKIWHIESWQDNSPKLPVRHFSNLNLKPFAEQFPHGMKWLAEEIRKLGFMPGIWTVPFGTGNAEFYEEHKDWFLHNPDGTPMSNWAGKYVIDPSQEAVRNHMEETHRVMSKEWGYDYFKIDGMSGANRGYSAHFYEMPNVRAAFKNPDIEAPFQLCVEAIRRGIGEEAIWLACQGHFTGPEAAYADAGRTGSDIVHPGNPPQWSNYLNQARITLNQVFVNNILWWSDPDTLLVGKAPIETARLATTVVALPGQMMFAGDKLAELSPERMRLLQQALPVCDVRPLDLYPIYELIPVWDLKIKRSFGEWDIVSLFNFSEESRVITTSIRDLGLPDDDYVYYNFWTGQWGETSGSFGFELPRHSNALLALHPKASHPQFLSTDRHVTQGGVSLEALVWDDASKTLSGATQVVAGFPSTLVFRVPEGYSLDKVTVDGAAVVHGMTRNGLLEVTLAADVSRSVAWALRFECG
ncbi:MAG: alpha-galactosidase [Candidatus Hydrogenedentota bacterium]